MPSPDEHARRQAWSAYWATGGLHSCVGSFAGNYSGAIGDFWSAVFGRLRAGQRVLDLATGNGALPLMIQERQAGLPGLRVDAVDLAQVAPAWHEPHDHPAIRFHSGVAMERLPFDDQVFDLCISQFGFEYARRDAALAECLRVTAADGGIALVMHHAGSVLVEVGRSELDNQAVLLAQDGIVAAAEAVLPWFAKARAGVNLHANAEALRAREDYNAAIRSLAERIASSPAPDLLVETRDWIGTLLAGTAPDPAPGLRALAEYRAAVAAAGLRTAELIEHALDAGSATSLADSIRAARPGHVVRCEALSQREGILGWALTAWPAPRPPERSARVRIPVK